MLVLYGTSILYLQRIADGNNPVNNMPDFPLEALNGYLEEAMNQELGKSVTRATEKGNAIGIYSEKRTSMRGQEYMTTIYGKKAQEFLVSHMEAILNGEIL